VPVACNFNCLFENKGLLSVIGGHVHCKCGNVSETVQDGNDVATDQQREVMYDSWNICTSDDLEWPPGSFTCCFFVQLCRSWQNFHRRSSCVALSLCDSWASCFKFTSCPLSNYLTLDLNYEFCCSAWINCSRNVQAEGCTFHDLFTQVLQYNGWSQFNTHDGNQQRYKEAIDSLQHLCNNIEPGQTSPFLQHTFHCIATLQQNYNVLILILPRDAVLARYACCLSSCFCRSVRPSICSSVTGWCSNKAAKAIITQITPHDGSRKSIFWCQAPQRNSNGGAIWTHLFTRTVE